MIHTVIGFMFNPEKTKVLLLKKNRPDWQKGKFSGIGGKIEVNETSIQAMIREFIEETGMFVDNWTYRGKLINENTFNNRGDKWVIDVYTSFGEIESAITTTDEIVKVFSLNELDQVNKLDSINFLIPLLLGPVLSFEIFINE